jgi:hypothetical protein
VTADATEERGLVAEATEVGAAGFGEFLEEVDGSGVFGLEEGSVNRGDAFFAVDLVSGDLEYGLAREAVDGVAVTGDKGLGRHVAGGVAVAGFAAGEDEGGGHAFDVPLPGTRDGFVEIVEVEDEFAVGGGEGAEVLDVGVAAELDGEAGVGEAGEVGGHDGDGAAEEGEGVDAHTRIFDGQERGEAAGAGGFEDGDGIERAGLGVEGDVELARDGVTEAFAFGDALGGIGKQWDRHEDIVWGGDTLRAW